MKRHTQIYIAVLLLFLLVAPRSYALSSDDDQLQRAVALMDNELWQLAYDVFSEIDTAEQTNGVADSLYGKLLFSMGLCQMALAKENEGGAREANYKRALIDFERCGKFIGSPSDPNLYVNRSTLRMGMCYQALEEFDKAYSAYQGFLKLRNQLKDTYDHRSLLINLVKTSIYRSLAQADEVFGYIQQLVERRDIDGQSKGPVAVLLIEALGSDKIKFSIEQNSQLLGWLEQFIEARDGSVLLSLSLEAQELLNEGELLRAQKLLEVLPWTDQSENGIDFSKTEGIDGELVARIVEQLAYTHLAQVRNLLLGQLVEEFPESSRLSEWLYRTVIARFEQGDIEQARLAIQLYKSKFADGEQRHAINLLEMSSLFDAGRYAEALSLAESYTPVESADRIYVMAGATCFLGEYQRSLDLSSEYLEKFPSGEREESVRYYQGVSCAHLGYSTQARSILSEIGDVSLYGYVQYEIAMLDFGAAAYSEVLARLESMRSLELAERLKVQVDLLAARVSAILRQRDAADRLYVEALESAQSNKFTKLEQEILFYMIAFHGREEIGGEPNLELEKSLPYYDAFFPRFLESAYATQAASVAMPALLKSGQLKRGIMNLELVLGARCDSASEAGIRDAARSLIWAKIDSGVKPSDLKRGLEQEGLSTYTIVRWLALIGVYEAGLEQAHSSWGRKFRYDAKIRAMYAKLSQMVTDRSVPAYVEAELAEWYLVDDNSPELAKEYYLRALTSSLSRQRELAEIGLAKSLRLIGGAANLNKAKELIDELLIRHVEDTELLEMVTYESVELLYDLRSLEQLTGQARGYIAEQKFDYKRARVWFILAKSYDLRGLNEDAIANYTRIFASYTRILEVSAPSVERLTLITWQRNMPEMAEGKSDRQVAYQLAHRYLTMLKAYPEWEKKRDGVRESLAEIQKNVDLWEASGEVRTVAEQLEDLRRGRR